MKTLLAAAAVAIWVAAGTHPAEIRAETQKRADASFALPVPDVPGDPLAGSGKVRRRHLARLQLMKGTGPVTPVRDAALALPRRAAPPRHLFMGRLELIRESTQGASKILRDDFTLADDPARHHLPEFDFKIVQHGSHLIPAQRGLILTSHPTWNYILGPGRTWRENDDGGMTRASLPFTLVQWNQNCTHNGTLTFLFNDAGISRVWYQVTQETCLHFKADLWGMLDAVYHREHVEGSKRVQRRFAREVAQRMPIKSVDELAIDFPGIDVTRFGGNVDAEHLTTYGLIAGGKNYRGRCKSRYGKYPHCEVMRLPSYSTAKSAFLGIALMRLAQTDGLQVLNELIRKRVPEVEDSIGDWSTVTLANTLDMATGNYWSTSIWADENGSAMARFFGVESYAARIVAALNAPRKEPPGQRWVYRSSDTFIFTRALEVYLKERDGPETDLFEWYVDEILAPLDIGRGAYTTLRTSDDGWSGQPLGYSGLFWIPDDIAKITEFLNVEAGNHDGEQLLHPSLLAAAMQQDSDNRGLLAGPDWYYKQGFHGQHYEIPGLPPDRREFWAPYMLGYGGVVFVMMPNGTTYYYISDNREFIWDSAVTESMTSIDGGFSSRVQAADRKPNRHGMLAVPPGRRTFLQVRSR